MKYFIIDVWQYYEYALNSEYARVLNMLGLHIALNTIIHNRYLGRFWVMPRVLIMPVLHGFR